MRSIQNEMAKIIGYLKNMGFWWTIEENHVEIYLNYQNLNSLITTVVDTNRLDNSEKNIFRRVKILDPQNP